eukprot:INCI5322.4.p1 GENE.INCI5322.4~~INCI5322.4.p1  ORF type:complete len:558 (-),score=100.21 INCI5322.4:1485-2945(-)
MGSNSSHGSLLGVENLRKQATTKSLAVSKSAVPALQLGNAAQMVTGIGWSASVSAQTAPASVGTHASATNAVEVTPARTSSLPSSATPVAPATLALVPASARVSRISDFSRGEDKADAVLLRSIGDWDEFQDPKKRRLFFVNRSTGTSTYVKPTEFKTATELELYVAQEAAAAGVVDQGNVVEDLMERAIADQAVAGSDYFERVDEFTKLPPTNRGYQMLLRMGWDRSGGLGKNGRGLLEPIKVDAHYNGLGLGKKVEDEEHNAVAAKERRKLAIEKVDISAEERARRDKTKEKIEATEEAVSEMNKPFYCSDCDKQYTNTMQYQEHMQSYDHHHTVRLKEMKARERTRFGADKKAKERAREQKAMRAMMRKASKAQRKEEKMQRKKTKQQALLQSSNVPALASKIQSAPPLPDASVSAGSTAFSGLTFSIGIRKSSAPQATEQPQLQQPAEEPSKPRAVFGGFSLSKKKLRKPSIAKAPSIFGAP